MSNSHKITVIEINGRPDFQRTKEQVQEGFLRRRLENHLNTILTYAEERKAELITKLSFLLKDYKQYSAFIEQLLNTEQSLGERLNKPQIQIFIDDMASIVKRDYTKYLFNLKRGNYNTATRFRDMAKIYRVYQSDLFSISPELDNIQKKEIPQTASEIASKIALDLFFFLTSCFHFIYPVHLIEDDYSKLNQELIENAKKDCDLKYKDLLSMEKGCQYLVDSLEYSCMLPDDILRLAKKIRLLLKLEKLGITNVDDIQKCLNRQGGPFPNGENGRPWGNIPAKILQELYKEYIKPIVPSPTDASTPSEETTVTIEKALQQKNLNLLELELVPDDFQPEDSKKKSDKSDPDDLDEKDCRQAVQSFFKDIKNNPEYDNLRRYIQICRDSNSLNDELPEIPQDKRKEFQCEARLEHETNGVSYFYLLLCEISVRLLESEISPAINEQMEIVRQNLRLPNRKQCQELLECIIHRPERNWFKIFIYIRDFWV